jgi:exosortase/archaeosortase family protein
VWGVQAAFKGVAGTTPVEAFVEYGLVLPMAGFAAMLGWSPAVHGQTLTYMTATGPLSVEVGAACSGLQAMALFGGVLAVYLLVERPGGRAVAAWSALGLAGVYLANLARLFVLAVVGHAWGRDALLRVHADAGWVFFVAWALLFAWLARRHSARRRQVQPASA